MSQTKKLLRLDSRDQQKLPFYKTHDCTFNLSDGGLYRVKEIELLSFSCPMTAYNINTNNNMLYIKDNVGASQSIAIPPSNYDINSLVAILKQSLESITSLTFTVSFSDTTMKLKISATDSFRLMFGTSKINSIANILGFYEIDTVASDEIEAPSVLNLSVPLYINIMISDCENSIKSSNCYDLASFSCDTIGNNSDVLTWTQNCYNEQIVKCYKDNIQSFNVSLRTYDNKFYDINNSNWTMLLKLHY